MFLENELMYGQTFTVPDEYWDPDFVVDLHKAHIERAGTDVTIVAHSKAVVTLHPNCQPLPLHFINDPN